VYDTVWTRWTRFKSLDIQFDNPAQPASHEVENWHNTWRHGVGLVWAPGGNWEYRTGLNYDPSPIKGPEFRGPLIPISDEWDVAVGATYHWNPKLAIHLGFFHTFFENTSSRSQGPTGDVLVGKWKGNLIEVYSLGFTYYLS
jgi:long-chain fatty acid transport protein